MADAPAVATVPRCPWCSAALQSLTDAACPECGATLTGPSDDQQQVPGVTTLDTDAILRARSAVSRPRNRFLSFITGDVDDGSETGGAGDSIAPPSEAVRREMLKMEIAAEVADLEAEVHARVVEAEVEAREAGRVQPDAAFEVPHVLSAEEAEAVIDPLIPQVGETS